ncbi:MAG: cytochrome c oxidase subunit II, partial [Dehalococcoidia bacterium]
DALRIEVHAHQWWWEVRYPDQGDGGVTAFTTANEIHIPTGEEVHIDLTSEDVIHSLWVPQLSGKMDLVPGKTNTMYLEATEDGTYQGMCAEFCGLQHARMRFLVVAHPRADFDAWAAAQAEPAGPPSEADGADEGELLRGQQVFLGAACVYCHTIEGTSASGTVGPDLTHLGSRATLAGGTIENTPANLAQWVANPPSIKPGTQMPPTSLSGDALNALLAYLESLE